MLGPAAPDDTGPLGIALIDRAEVTCLIEEGHELGCLSSTDVAAALRDVEVTVTQLEELLLVLADMGIEIVEDDAPAVPETTDDSSDDGDPAPKLDLSMKTVSSQSRAPVLPRDGQGAAADGRRGGRARQAHRAPRRGRRGAG